MLIVPEVERTYRFCEINFALRWLLFSSQLFYQITHMMCKVIFIILPFIVIGTFDRHFSANE